MNSELSDQSIRDIAANLRQQEEIKAGRLKPNNRVQATPQSKVESDPGSPEISTAPPYISDEARLGDNYGF